MEREQLRQNLLASLEGDTGEKFDSLNDTTNLRTDLGLDSIDIVQLVIGIQTDYGILLDAKELEKVVLVGDFLDLLQAKLAAKKAAA
jgi:acyl carrier protein